MSLCVASTKTGRPCSNMAFKSSRFCQVHYLNGFLCELPIVGLGMGIGHLILPGFGGMLAGGVGSFVMNKFIEENVMSKKRVFVSFDFDDDKKLKGFIIGQSKLADSPFSVVDHSLKEAAPESDWKDKARAAIKRSEIVLVMVGPMTYRAPGVLAEVKMAREEGVPIVQVIGYKDGDYTRVNDAGRLYRWNWDNLKNLLG